MTRRWGTQLLRVFFAWRLLLLFLPPAVVFGTVSFFDSPHHFPACAPCSFELLGRAVEGSFDFSPCFVCASFEAFRPINGGLVLVRPRHEQTDLRAQFFQLRIEQFFSRFSFLPHSNLLRQSLSISSKLFRNSPICKPRYTHLIQCMLPSAFFFSGRVVSA
jgi:hypothetical protein